VGKKKLIHFQENLTFPHLFQPRFSDLANGFPLQSKWHSDFFHNENPIVLELGCGKGEYTVGLAVKYPAKNFIGIDFKGARLWRGSKSVQENGLKNVAFIRSRVDHIEQFFAPGEVSEIWITFPDPQPGKERKRLTSPVFLNRYDNLLSSVGIIHLKTDDTNFYAYTLSVLELNRHNLLFATDDLYGSGFSEDVISIRTYYENIWLGQGKKICYIKFNLNRS
jgi:tRNA (guanine-N7-)-methyltransferase